MVLARVNESHDTVVACFLPIDVIRELKFALAVVVCCLPIDVIRVLKFSLAVVACCLPIDVIRELKSGIELEAWVGGGVRVLIAYPPGGA